ncbi:MAG: HAD hydrolase-like protein [Candidatus Omnitrophica bacterium]|nr:HAD hydrolase-like protein [Candidatus Omnitrophota bacterium]
MKNKYDTIVFDLGNTVIRFDHNISAGKLVNLFNLDQKKVYDFFFDSEITRAFEKGLLSPRGFYIKATEFLGIKISYEDFVPIWNDIFREDEKVCRLARQLKKTHRLFLLSNVNRLHFEYIEEKFDIIKIFDELVLSFVVGAVKPERPIFDDVVRRAGGDRSRMLYIDDREDLIKEATALGIPSIRFEGADKLKDQLSELGVI